MRLIKSVEIIKYRSIYKARFDTPDIVILSGKNNVGKSNVLKALNLFFHGYSTYDSPYTSAKDFNVAYTGGAGGRREIQVKLNFRGHGTGKLKDDFSVRKTFYEGQASQPIYESSNMDTQAALDKPDGRVLREFTRFYNKLDYVYVPAVRDRDFTRRLFAMFERALDGVPGKNFNNALKEISDILGEQSRSVSDDFEKMLGVKTRAALSTRVTDILEAIKIEVESDMEVTQKKGGRSRVYIDLFSNGDGVLMSYVPHLLGYISAHQTRHNYIWGFEEPENSLEYSKVQILAEKFLTEFSKHAQIFLTTHSPAFINLEQADKVALMRVYTVPGEVKGTTQISAIGQIQQRLLLAGLKLDERDVLREELGLTELAHQIDNRVKEIQDEIRHLTEQNNAFARPTLISEGNNRDYLQAAKTLYDPEGQYDIIDGGGKDDLKHMYDNLIKIGRHQKVAIVWDCECIQYASLNETVDILPMVLDKHPQNTRILKGIEASMPEEEILANQGEYFERKDTKDGGSVSVPRKTKIASYFCQNPDSANFTTLRPVIEKMREFVS